MAKSSLKKLPKFEDPKQQIEDGKLKYDQTTKKYEVMPEKKCQKQTLIN